MDDQEDGTGQIKLAKLGVCISKLALTQREDKTMVQSMQAPPVQVLTRNRFSTRGTLEDQFKQSLTGVDRREQVAQNDEANRVMSKEHRLAIRASRRTRESQESMESLGAPMFGNEGISGRRGSVAMAAMGEDGMPRGGRRGSIGLGLGDEGLGPGRRRGSLGLGDELTEGIFGAGSKRRGSVLQLPIGLTMGNGGGGMDRNPMPPGAGRRGSMFGGGARRGSLALVAMPDLDGMLDEQYGGDMAGAGANGRRSSITLALPQHMLEMILSSNDGQKNTSEPTPTPRVVLPAPTSHQSSPRQLANASISSTTAASPRESLPALSPRLSPRADGGDKTSKMAKPLKAGFVVPDAMRKRTVWHEHVEMAREHAPETSASFHSPSFYKSRMTCVPVGCASNQWNDPEPVPPRTPARWKVRGPNRQARIK